MLCKQEQQKLLPKTPKLITQSSFFLISVLNWVEFLSVMRENLRIISFKSEDFADKDKENANSLRIYLSFNTPAVAA